jgi:hypothetical protein
MAEYKAHSLVANLLITAIPGILKVFQIGVDLPLKLWQRSL